jgi:hypothetical protein
LLFGEAFVKKPTKTFSSTGFEFEQLPAIRKHPPQCWNGSAWRAPQPLKASSNPTLDTPEEVAEKVSSDATSDPSG